MVPVRQTMSKAVCDCEPFTSFQLSENNYHLSAKLQKKILFNNLKKNNDPTLDY